MTPLYRQENGGSGRRHQVPQPGRAKAGFNAGQLTTEVAISAPQYAAAPKGASEGWFAQDHVNPPSMRKSGVWGKGRGHGAPIHKDRWAFPGPSCHSAQAQRGPGFNRLLGLGSNHTPLRESPSRQLLIPSL